MVKTCTTWEAQALVKVRGLIRTFVKNDFGFNKTFVVLVSGMMNNPNSNRSSLSSQRGTLEAASKEDDSPPSTASHHNTNRSKLDQNLGDDQKIKMEIDDDDDKNESSDQTKPEENDKPGIVISVIDGRSIEWIHQGDHNSLLESFWVSSDGKLISKTNPGNPKKLTVLDLSPLTQEFRKILASCHVPEKKTVRIKFVLFLCAQTSLQLVQSNSISTSRFK